MVSDIYNTDIAAYIENINVLNSVPYPYVVIAPSYMVYTADYSSLLKTQAATNVPSISAATVWMSSFGVSANNAVTNAPMRSPSAGPSDSVKVDLKRLMNSGSRPRGFRRNFIFDLSDDP